jgi:tryptophan synthase alpha chain
MSDRVAAMFERTHAEGRPALIPFVPGGWPEPDATLEIVRAAVQGGADAIEIGVPFSDPLADGVTNQLAYGEALSQGVNVETILEIVRSIRAEGVEVPLLLMGYSNPFFAYGADRFVERAVAGGVDGLIIVDLPPEEAGALAARARGAGLHMVYLLAPTSTPERIEAVTREATGFIYCVSVTGVTGARDALPDELPEFLRRVREHTDLPLAVGFGISTREHVEAVGRVADAVIVGSAFVQMVARSSGPERPRAVRTFVEELSGRRGAATGAQEPAAADG